MTGSPRPGATSTCTPASRPTSRARRAPGPLGVAVDVKRKDGSRTLLVPNVKQAEAMDFAGFFAAYEELIRKVGSGKLAPEDFAGTTVSITNPGMIGTVQVVPRLMAGQGCNGGGRSVRY